MVLSAFAQSIVDDLKYPTYAALMRYYGYTWEAFTLTTEDDYILTTFHITGKVGQDTIPRDESLQPILFMPGQGSDACTTILPVKD